MDGCIYKVLFYMITVYQIGGISDTCTRFQIPNPSAITEGKTLNGFTYDELSNFPTMLSCGMRCLKQNKCKSVNFNVKLGICQLNSESHLTEPSALTSSTDFQNHYVSDWPQEILGPCAYHGCPEEQVCDPVSNSMSIDRYTCTQCVPLAGCANCLREFATIQDAGVLYTYKPIGCFRAHQSPNPLPTLLQSFRSNIDWSDVAATVAKCISISAQAGYKYFGIEYYGECWVDQEFEITNHTIVAATDCSATHCDKGYPKDNYMFVYQHM